MGKYMVLERDEEIGIILINRPEVLNALDAAGWEELRVNLAECENDPSIRVVIVTGAGEKAFVAGANIKAMTERSMIATLEGQVSGILKGIAKMSKPVIAAVNGFAFGGGCELAMACDVRIASENAKLGQTEINVGILPGGGGTQRLTRLVGVGKALEMILTGAVVSAQEAKEIGLVNKVVPLESLMDEAKKMAKKMSSKSPITLRLAKIAILDGADTNFDAGLLLEVLCQTIVFGTEDHLEGLKAFLEKREPVFTGN